MHFTRADVEEFFARYSSLFNAAVHGAENIQEISALYAQEFIGANPHGVRAGRADAEFEAALAQGYARYRAMGTQRMEVTGIDIHAIDDKHCLAHVTWDSLYQKPGDAATRIAFEVTYLLQQQSDALKVFGWISGDEEALLKEHGLV